MSYVCSVCGYKAIKPLGKCPNCGEWDTFIREGEFKGKRKLEVKKLKDVELGEGFRIDTGISILNSVLGGGIFKGSVILLGGKPGVGKSTLFLQIAHYLSRRGYRVLFVSAEESVYQVRQRAERLKVDSDIDITEEANLDTVLENAGNYDVLFVDSIQAVYTEDISSPPGSISQVRFCADNLFKFAKERGISILISGHITKSGIIAGPKTLEHTVDVVLYLEGDKGGILRMLRAEKNRFGPTDEVGFFTMEERGLFPVEDPSLYFYKPPQVPKVGLSYTVMMKGNVPIVLEIQSLVHYSYYPVPTRHSVGYDPKRLAMG
jgi:DNA repair protein RadA/Sms